MHIENLQRGNRMDGPLFAYFATLYGPNNSEPYPDTPGELAHLFCSLVCDLLHRCSTDGIDGRAILFDAMRLHQEEVNFPEA